MAAYLFVATGSIILIGILPWTTLYASAIVQNIIRITDIIATLIEMRSRNGPYGTSLTFSELIDDFSAIVAFHSLTILGHLVWEALGRTISTVPSTVNLLPGCAV